jgi:fibronectin-binding autotransporter adhesin
MMTTIPCLRVVVGAVLLAMAAGASAVAQTSWNGAVDGHWSDAANWLSGIPNANAVTISQSGASYMVTYDGTDAGSFAPFGSLTLSNTGTNTTTLTVGAGGFSFGGDLTLARGGNIEVQSGGVLTQTSGSVKGMAVGSGITIRSGGSAFLVADGGVNHSGAFLIESGGSLTWGAGTTGGNLNLASSGTIDNRGTLRIEGGGPLSLSGGTMTNSGDIVYKLTSFGQNSVIVGNGSTSVMTMTAGTMVTPKGTLWDRGYAIGGRLATGASANNSFETMTGGSVTNQEVLLIGTSSGNTSNLASVNNRLDLSGGSWVNGAAEQTKEYLQSVIIGGNVTRWDPSVGTVANMAPAGTIKGALNVSGTGSFTSFGNMYLGAGGGEGTLSISGGSVTVANAGNAILKLGVAGTELGNTASTSKDQKGAVTTVGNGILNLSGGSLTVDNLVTTAGHSTINFTGGTMTLSKSASVNTGSVFSVGDGAQSATLNLSSASGNYSFANGTSVKANATLNAQGTMTGGLEMLGTLVIGGAGNAAALEAGVVTLGSGARSCFDILSGGSQIDLLTGSSIAYGGTLYLNFTGLYTVGDSFQIFDFGTQSADFSNIVASGLGAGETAVFDAATGSVSIAAIPEPSEMALLGLGLTAVCLLRLRSGRSAA